MDQRSQTSPNHFIHLVFGPNTNARSSKYSIFNCLNDPLDEIVAGACFLLWASALVLQLQNNDFRQRNYRSVLLSFFMAISISYLFGA